MIIKYTYLAYSNNEVECEKKVQDDRVPQAIAELRALFKDSTTPLMSINGEREKMNVVIERQTGGYPGEYAEGDSNIVVIKQ